MSTTVTACTPRTLNKRIAQLFEHFGAQGRGVDVDVGRHHLHRIQIEIAPTEQGQDFLGDADAVDEADVDTHGAVLGSGVRRVASMPWGGRNGEILRRTSGATITNVGAGLLAKAV